MRYAVHLRDQSYIRAYVHHPSKPQLLAAHSKSRFLRNVIINTSYKKFPFGSGDDPYKLLLYLYSRIYILMFDRDTPGIGLSGNIGS